MKREERKNQYQETILSSAYALLQSREWKNIKADDIAREAEISKKTLYFYFSSLDEIYLKLIKQSFMKLNQAFDMEIDMNLEIKELLTKLAYVYLRFSFDHPLETTLMIHYNRLTYQSEFIDIVNDIDEIANKYEIFNLFKDKHLDEEIYTRQIALFLWSYIIGFIYLLQNKNQWITEYYGQSSTQTIKSHIAILRKVMDDLL
ncbi:MAG: TetR/AcrR family transcriptional regulator [Candidatus Izemoplasmatales bacterium]|nr:TetR/AcrR family transcriptional regulator [Candidatus Izemoplasmatales bacterium]MDD4070410.1 TetR/AcrR family transcriptional regulator [Candidatus Izemoplasmatales bacterium]